MTARVTFRIGVAASILLAGVAVHGYSAVALSLRGFPLGMALVPAFFATGCAAGIYGLSRRRYWARVFTLGIGVLGLVELACWSTHIPAILPWAFWATQVALFATLTLAMLGSPMRQAFEEGSAGRWRFDDPLLRFTRMATVVGIGTPPMLFSMAADAVYTTEDLGRILAVAAGAGMLSALLLLAAGKSAGLAVLGLSSPLAAFAVWRTVSHFDQNPSFAAEKQYHALTVADAASSVPGIVFGIALLFAFSPRVVAYLRRS
jgi:hypothetical protein